MHQLKGTLWAGLKMFFGSALTVIFISLGRLSPPAAQGISSLRRALPRDGSSEYLMRVIRRAVAVAPLGIGKVPTRGFFSLYSAKMPSLIEDKKDITLSVRH
jgi:hypothetical protein